MSMCQQCVGILQLSLFTANKPDLSKRGAREVSAPKVLQVFRKCETSCSTYASRVPLHEPRECCGIRERETDRLQES